MHKNIYLLSIVQMLAMAGPPMVTMLGGIVGGQLAPSPKLDTLPLACMMLGIGLFSVPAALTMKRIGRKAGFVSASLVAVLASLGAANAIRMESFVIFCLSLLMLGGNVAFVQQFRFAAAESVPPKLVGTAISWVVAGGIIASYLGPELGKRFKDEAETPFMGAFLAMGGIYLLASLLLLFYRNVEPPTPPQGHDEPRPLKEILMQSKFLLSVAAGMTAFGTMVTIMMATPVSMHVYDGFSLEQVALIIQIHTVCMYLPSLFTGYMLLRLGMIKMMVLGLVALALAVTCNVSGHNLLTYAVGLAFLGIGWNLLFISATSMLTQCYRHAERFKVQAANDFLVYSVMGLGSLSAGPLLKTMGWEMTNLITLPLLILMLVGIFLHLGKERRLALVGE